MLQNSSRQRDNSVDLPWRTDILYKTYRKTHKTYQNRETCPSLSCTRFYLGGHTFCIRFTKTEELKSSDGTFVRYHQSSYQDFMQCFERYDQFSHNGFMHCFVWYQYSYHEFMHCFESYHQHSYQDFQQCFG